jgi:hypothetical protein
VYVGVRTDLDEAHPFPRPTDLIIINRPLLTNFGLLRAQFFGLYALYTSLFNFNFAQLCFARFLCFLCLLFSLSRSFFREQVLHAPAVRLVTFLAFQPVVNNVALPVASRL